MNSNSIKDGHARRVYFSFFTIRNYPRPPYFSDNFSFGLCLNLNIIYVGKAVSIGFQKA
jgi:hypothetical protein